MELKENQAALILEASAEGEITVDVQALDLKGFASALCVMRSGNEAHAQRTTAGRTDGHARGG